jgi:GH35 family endo-1,4-beta-xylanase
VASVTLVLWGSVGSQAVVEAYDAHGEVADRVSREKVPERTGPEQPVPSFDLTVKAPEIAAVRFSGAPPGGYLVCDEVRVTQARDPATNWSLRHAAKGRFLVGTAVSSRHLDNPALVALVAEQFDTLTAENEFKQISLQSWPGEFRFAEADKFVDFAREHRMRVVGHTLCWHRQSPAFLFRARTASPCRATRL